MHFHSHASDFFFVLLQRVLARYCHTRVYVRAHVSDMILGVVVGDVVWLANECSFEELLKY